MALLQEKWEKIVGEWLNGKTFPIPDTINGIEQPKKEEWNITLVDVLVLKGIIPDHVQDDATLYKILMLQMERLVLKSCGS
jgi:hypothetical protein